MCRELEQVSRAMEVDVSNLRGALVAKQQEAIVAAQSLQEHVQVSVEEKRQLNEQIRSVLRNRCPAPSLTHFDFSTIQEIAKRLDVKQQEMKAAIENKENELSETLQSMETLQAAAAADKIEFLREQQRLMETVGQLEGSLNSTSVALALKAGELAAALRTIEETLQLGVEKQQQLATAHAELSVLSAQIRDMHQVQLELQSQLESSRAESLALVHENSQLKNQITGMDAEMGELRGNVALLEVERELKVKAEIREENERRERIACTAQLLATQKDHTEKMAALEERSETMHRAMEGTIVDLEAAKSSVMQELSEARLSVAGYLAEIEAFKAELERKNVDCEASEELSIAKGELEVLRRRLEEKTLLDTADLLKAEARIKELENELVAAEQMRRKLRNTIAELKGNVRVYARVRPLLPSDGSDVRDSQIVANTENATVKVGARTDKEEDHVFTFDKSFGPSVSQEAVFSDVSEFVQSALDGYAVCLFSYGQTGSGKTHTMTGTGTGTMRGIIPRAMEQVGSYKNELERKGWEYQMEISYIEIYNENIRDLLRDTPFDDSKHEIKRDVQGGTYVSDVMMMTVDPNDKELIDGIMERAARFRSVGCTAMNEQSSRSHAVFTLHLRASNAEQGLTLKGALSLVDLAGSERLDRSGATGSRMKETISINKSLSALIDVFAAIGNKQSHIPFRNSKLTYLLQPALSGDGKTLMLVNLSPTEDSISESLCSLRFASQVNQCELGKPKRQIKDVTSASATNTPMSSMATPLSSNAVNVKKARFK